METDKIKELHEMVSRLENFVEMSDAGSVSAMMITREKVKAIRIAMEKLLSEK